MLQQDLEAAFEEIAAEAWTRGQSPLERMYDCWVGEGHGKKPTPVTFRITRRATGQPFRVTSATRRTNWVVRGDRSIRLPRVFVCEHEPVWVGHGMIARFLPFRSAEVGSSRNRAPTRIDRIKQHFSAAFMSLITVDKSWVDILLRRARFAWSMTRSIGPIYWQTTGGCGIGNVAYRRQPPGITHRGG